MPKADVVNKAAVKNVPIIGFKNDRSLKITVLLLFFKVDTEDRPKPCNGKKRSCEVYRSVNDMSYFKRRETDETFNILKEPHDYSSNHVIYLFECKYVNITFLV